MAAIDFGGIFKNKVIYNYVTLGDVNKIGDSKQAFINALNKAAKTNYSVLNLEFYETSLVTTDLPERNSTVRVKVVPDKDQIADYIISYNRINTSDLGIINVDVVGKTLVSQILSQVNVLTSSNITPCDIVDGPLPLPDTNGKALINLVFKPNSVLFYSGTRITLSSEVSTVPGVTKASIGLSKVDNTSDLTKPVSTEQALAITNVLEQAKTYTDTAISSIQQGGTSNPLWGTVAW